MTKKLLLALSLLISLTCAAQVIEKYPGMRFYKFSPDGRYLLSGTSGVTIYDRQEKQYYRYGTEYGLGLGNSLSNTGIVVGYTGGGSRSCYWQGGEWHNLKLVDGETASIAMAHGVTPDGSRIVGAVDCRSITKKAWPMVSPVIWIWDSAKKDYVCQQLPEPDRDITGCLPQQVSATFISSDGKTVLGQVTDYRGFMEHQIIYRQAEDGSWSYEFSGDDRLVKPDAVWPPYPERPTKPQAADFLSDDEILAFNKANQAYKDSLEIVSLTGIKPRMPWYEDFINERKDEYEAALAEFNKKSDSYITDLYAFFDAYAQNITNDRFEFNSHKLSYNGKFYTGNYIYIDPDQDPDQPIKMFISPIVYNLDGSNQTYLTINEAMGEFSICDDGTITCGTPRDDSSVYSRKAFVIRPGEEPVNFLSWLKDRCPKGHEWVMENMKFDMSQYEEGGVPETVLTGTPSLNNDASMVLSYLMDPATDQYISYFIDFDAEPTLGVEDINEINPGIFYNAASGTLHIDGNPSRVELYDLSGRLLYGIADPAPTLYVKDMLGSGIYIVRLSSTHGDMTAKIMVR